MTGVLLIVAALLIGFAVAGFRGAIWVPARTQDTASIFSVAPLPKELRLLEFGSGDGRNLTLVHRALPRAKLTGIEINPIMWFISWIRAGRAAHVILGDGWQTDVSEYNTVLVFLMPKFMDRFKKKMCAELTPGSLVISYAFELPNMKPIMQQNNYFVYRIEKIR